MILNSGYYFEIWLYIASIGLVSLKIYCKLFVFCLCLSYLCYVNQLKANKMKNVTMKPGFVMNQEDINFLNSLPANMPETKLKKAEIEQIGAIYRRYISQVDNYDWSPSLIAIEQREKWPSGPRIKTHEVQRMILGWLVTYNENDKEMTPARACYVFYSSLTNRPAARRLLSFVYDVQPVYNV